MQRQSPNDVRQHLQAFENPLYLIGSATRALKGTNVFTRMATSAKVIKLRQLLAEKFPEAHAGTRQTRPVFTTGLSTLDKVGIPLGALTEVVSQEVSQGSGLLIHGFLQAAQINGYHVALIDGQDSFDPQSADRETCQRMLWVRCRTADEALKAADLLLRDGNLPLCVLDLRLNPDHELRRISKQVWYRLQTLVQRTQGVGIILTPRPMISSATVRLDLGNAFHLKDLDVSQSQLINRLMLPVTRRRTGFAPGTQSEHTSQEAVG